jgi:hypothetical protein
MRFGIGNKIGRRFSSTRQPPKNGRKKSLYKQLAKQTELSREDFIDVLLYIMERTPNELDRLLKDKNGKPNPETPVWIINLISSIYYDIKKGQLKTLDKLFDRLFGKPKMDVVSEVYRSDNTMISRVTNEDLENEINQIDQLMKELDVKRK